MSSIWRSFPVNFLPVSSSEREKRRKKVFLCRWRFLMKFPLSFADVCRLSITTLWFFLLFTSLKKKNFFVFNNPFYCCAKEKWNFHHGWKWRRVDDEQTILIFIVQCIRKFVRKLKKKVLSSDGEDDDDDDENSSIKAISFSYSWDSCDCHHLYTNRISLKGVILVVVRMKGKKEAVYIYFNKWNWVSPSDQFLRVSGMLIDPTHLKRFKFKKTTFRFSVHWGNWKYSEGKFPHCKSLYVEWRIMFQCIGRCSDLERFIENI